MRRLRLLDLFCGAGGAAVGYHRAGFEVVGVDCEPQPRYPFAFHRADALAIPLEGFDAIHASPPCQDWSRLHRCYGAPAHGTGIAPSWAAIFGRARRRRRWGSTG
jgi:DNA (cytosine-5)-methyltransferase 1